MNPWARLQSEKKVPYVKVTVPPCTVPGGTALLTETETDTEGWSLVFCVLYSLPSFVWGM